jgi:general nucleoside transport system ATP-binding protein
MDDPALRLQVIDVSKSFYGVPAIAEVDLELVGGEVHGLLGENGAGKSTLCSVLAGLYRPDSGRIVLDGAEVHLRSPQDAARLGIGMVYQHFRLVDSFTVTENIVLGLHRAIGSAAMRDVAGRVDQLAGEYGLQVDPSAAIWQLSVGERQRVEILKQLFRGARLLILDEPTAVLAPHEAEHLFDAVGQMTAKGHAVVLVSHKMHEILNHTDRVTVLRAGRNVGGGATSTVTTASLATMMFGGHTAAPARHVSAAEQVGDEVLAVHDLRVVGDHGLPAVDGASLSVRRGEIVGLAGVAGNGQRELHETIAGLRRAAAGTVRVAGNDVTGASPKARHAAGLAYVPEDRTGTGLAAGLPLDDNLVLRSYDRPPHSRSGVISPRAVRATAAELTASFDVRGARAGMPVSFMSGGNQQKAILARELTEPHEVLVAAAPTRGLDLSASEAVRAHLRTEREHGRGVLLFSEDLAEILDLADVVLVMFRGVVVGRFDRREGEPDVEQIGLLMTGEAVAL